MKYEKWQCQHCGSDTKMVETLIDDEFTYNVDTKEFEPMGFSDKFEHTGNAYCKDCGKSWTGL